jgi:predicted MPP superfamily phosphohydrolase
LCGAVARFLAGRLETLLIPKDKDKVVRFTRRKLLQTSAAVVVGGGLAISANATMFEPNDPKVVRIEISLDRLPGDWDGLRIVQLSDFHYDQHFSVVPIRKAVAIARGLEPDLVVLTGDFVTVPVFGGDLGRKRSAGAIEPCASLLRPLRARLGTWASLGNHDVGSAPKRIIAALQARGIPVLRNASAPLEEKGSRLWLAGLDDVLEGKPDLALALQGVPPGEPVILLAHEPDFATRVARFPVDLQLSGHSHGGQVRFPLIGAPVLPKLGRKFPWGLHQISKLKLYTNIGIGTIRVPVRFNCPPEVTLITLRAKAGTTPHP